MIFKKSNKVQLLHNKFVYNTTAVCKYNNEVNENNDYINRGIYIYILNIKIVKWGVNYRSRIKKYFNFLF